MTELLALYNELIHIPIGKIPIGIDGLLNEYNPKMDDPIIKGLDGGGRHFFRMALATANVDDGNRYGIITIHQKEPTVTSSWVVVNNKGLLSHYFDETKMTVDFIQVIRSLLTAGITAITRKEDNCVVVAVGLKKKKDNYKETLTALH